MYGSEFFFIKILLKVIGRNKTKHFVTLLITYSLQKKLNLRFLCFCKCQFFKALSG